MASSHWGPQGHCGSPLFPRKGSLGGGTCESLALVGRGGGTLPGFSVCELSGLLWGTRRHGQVSVPRGVVGDPGPYRGTARGEAEGGGEGRGLDCFTELPPPAFG